MGSVLRYIQIDVLKSVDCKEVNEDGVVLDLWGSEDNVCSEE